MPVYVLSEQFRFPSPSEAVEGGLLAIGGDLHPRRLLLAYSKGIFPWPIEGYPLAWFSPDQRMVMEPGEHRRTRSMRKLIRRGDMTVSADSAFGEVVKACSQVPRPGQSGTWIDSGIQSAYLELHRQGHAHSIEVWQHGELVGGLYGISLGGMFCGESMFHRVSNASKVAYFALSEQLRRWRFDLIDCQMHTDHLESLGAFEMERETFLNRLSDSRNRPSRTGRWQLDPDVLEASASVEPERGEQDALG